MTLKTLNGMYNGNYPYINIQDLNRKLFCTFVPIDDIGNFIKRIISLYEIQYNKIFILEVNNGSDEYVCTYNIEPGNINSIPDNTVMVHRKKDYNTLYTINALNEIIKKLNGGVVDNRFPIEWNHYRNSLLLTQQDELRELKTKIFKIIEI
jgi:hypothetical protein